MQEANGKLLDSLGLTNLNNKRCKNSNLKGNISNIQKSLSSEYNFELIYLRSNFFIQVGLAHVFSFIANDNE